MILELSFSTVIHSLWDSSSPQRSGSLTTMLSTLLPKPLSGLHVAHPTPTNASCGCLPPRHCGQASPCSLTCDCSLFSGPWSSSVSNHRSPSQDDAWLYTGWSTESRSVLLLMLEGVTVKLSPGTELQLHTTPQLPTLAELKFTTSGKKWGSG